MQTLIELFEQRAEKFSTNPLLWEKKNGKYQSLSYADAKNDVYLLSAGLQSYGLEPNQHIALLAEGRNDWLLGELAIFYSGCVNVPLSIKLLPSEIEFRIVHSQTKAVMLSKWQMNKLVGILDQLPDLELIICMDDDYQPSELIQNKIVTFSQLREKGAEFLEKHKIDFERRKQMLGGDNIATISYTSGTTAEPKGIMLTQQNYVGNVEQVCSMIEIAPTARTLAILPWDHAFAHTACLYCFMFFGASVGSVDVGTKPMDTLKNIPINIKELQPNVLMSVPALAKNFRKNIEKGIRAKGAMGLFRFFLKLSYIYLGDGGNKGRGWRAVLAPMHHLADKLLYQKIKKEFGGKLEFFIGGGAILDAELQQFFASLGIPMFQGYGLTEATPIISANVPNGFRIGSSGKLVSPMELFIADENGAKLPVGQKGEIVIRGVNVMKGYWRNEQATSEAIRNKWLYTGDMGYMDSDGFLYLLGRFKSLMIGSDGEKYSPEGIEESMVENVDVIDQIVLYNNQCDYTVALIVPNIDAVKRRIERKHIENTDRERFAIELIQKGINHYKKGGNDQGLFPERWLPSTFSIANEAYSEANGLVNSTMKVIRGKVEERYADNIRRMYTSEGKNIFNAENIMVMGQWLEK
ncbi:MAG: AMP-dependent synthetase/ligase [Bacteroidales bacterium]